MAKPTVQLSVLDKFISGVDNIVKSFKSTITIQQFNAPYYCSDSLANKMHAYSNTLANNGANFAEKTNSSPLSDAQKQQVVRLMRVNHCGEICAQALYLGQSITANNEQQKTILQESAQDEVQHLSWTLHRLQELGGTHTKLASFFYIASLLIGLLAGACGDKWSLGFLAETEHQVQHHLESHLSKLPLQDKKSVAIITQMIEDEAKHASVAIALGANELPKSCKILMRIFAKVMTEVTYYI